MSTAGTTRVPMNALTALSGPMFASGPRVGTWDARDANAFVRLGNAKEKSTLRARVGYFPRSAYLLVPPACGWLDKNTRV